MVNSAKSESEGTLIERLSKMQGGTYEIGKKDEAHSKLGRYRQHVSKHIN